MPDLRALKLPSLSDPVLSFFSQLGILSVEDFLLQDTHNLVALAEQKSNGNQYKKAMRDIVLFLEENAASWLDGVDLLNQMQQMTSILPFGCTSLDELLEGGIRGGVVMELVGPSSSGKTQICIQTAASAILRGAMVVYIDTCNSFSSSRLAEVITGLSDSGNLQCETDLESSLNLLFCYRVHDVFSLLELLRQMDLDFSNQLQGCEWAQDRRNVKLIIVDSTSSLLTPILSSIYAQGHALMMDCGQMLRKLAVQNNISVMMTNHTVGGADGMAKPALGESWKGIAHVRVLLSRNLDTGTCTASLIKHSSMACNKKASFRLNKDGVQTL